MHAYKIFYTLVYVARCGPLLPKTWLAFKQDIKHSEGSSQKEDGPKLGPLTSLQALCSDGRALLSALRYKAEFRPPLSGTA